MSGPFGVTIDDPELEANLSALMSRVDALLESSTSDELPGVVDISRHLLDAGGKKFRPFLTLLAAQFGKPNDEMPATAAVTIELCHLATLYHDDVMDEATLRRGVPTAHSVWDNKAAILAGDLLFAKASALCCDLGMRAVEVQAETVTRLVRGQLAETLGPGESDEILHYRQVVADKTGALIAAACKLGAVVSDAPQSVAEALGAFGERIGIAFQLGDDILDVVGDPGAEGKNCGADLRQGIKTLPVLYALASTHAARDTLSPGDARLRELLEGNLDDDARLDEALALLRAHLGVTRARDDLQRCLDEARGILDGLPDIPARKVLDSLCTAAYDRVAV